MLKAELHTHIKGDSVDNIDYTIYDLINRAHELKFDVLAITCHQKVIWEKEWKKYAQKKGILLIRGVEAQIEGNDILFYDPPKEALKAKTLKNLYQIKKKNDFLIIAPHPFHFIPICLKKKILKHLDLFDAWEISYLYSKLINPNKLTKKLAKKYNKPLIGNSDVHSLKCLGKTYTLINSIKKNQAIFDAIRKGNTKIITKPLHFFEFIKESIDILRR